MDIKSKKPIISIKNEGQKLIYLIRKAFLEGSFFSSNNPTAEVQFILNKPIEIDPKLYRADPKDKTFLKDLIKKVEDGSIKLYTPSTLLNQSVYQISTSEIKAKADYDILTLLHKIRQIKLLWDTGERDSYQIINLTNSLRIAKERLESQEGDIFVI